MKYGMNEMLKKYSYFITLEVIKQTKQMYIENKKTCVNPSSSKSFSGGHITLYLIFR